MVTPLPEIPSDVLSLLDGYFKELQQARQHLLIAIERHRADVGEMRAHAWIVTLDRMKDDLATCSMACDECQEMPYKLALWPIGRGGWACDRHTNILKDKGLL